MSFTAKIGSEKHNGDEIDGRMLADRLLLWFKSSWMYTEINKDCRLT